MNEITCEELKQKLVKNDALNLIDVREDIEVETGVIPGSVHIPLGSVEARLSELDVSKEYIIICRSGNRSGQATMFLESRGYKAKNLVGGMLEWEGKVELLRAK